MSDPRRIPAARFVFLEPGLRGLRRGSGIVARRSGNIAGIGPEKIGIQCHARIKFDQIEEPPEVTPPNSISWGAVLLFHSAFQVGVSCHGNLRLQMLGRNMQVRRALRYITNPTTATIIFDQIESSFMLPQ